MYKNRLQEIDELKFKIDNFRPLSFDILLLNYVNKF